MDDGRMRIGILLPWAGIGIGGIGIGRICRREPSPLPGVPTAFARYLSRHAQNSERLKTALMPRWLYQAAENHHRPVASPWIVGMVMIGIGLTALTLAWIQHRQETNALRAQDPRLPYSLAGIMAGLIAILGLLALVTVAWRL